MIKLKRHINHLISSINCVCSITIFSSLSFFTMSIIFLKNSMSDKYYLNSYIPLAKQWSYVEFTLFCNRFTFKKICPMRY
jgi:hypothetical protein